MAIFPGLPMWAGTRKVKPHWVAVVQLGHMQVCTLLQTDNHASTPPLSFLQTECLSWRPTNSINALKATWNTWHKLNNRAPFTSVKTDDAVLHDNIGTSETGLCQFVAARDAICKTETLELKPLTLSCKITILPWDRINITVKGLWKISQHLHKSRNQKPSEHSK